MTQPLDSFPLFLSLPTEILSEIGAAVEAVEDCAHLRLTCKHVEACTFAAFARRFFRRRKFYRGRTSLDALFQISQSRLAPYLEHFVLGTELLSRYPPAQKAPIDITALQEAYREQTILLEGGWQHHILAQAFSRLSRLQVVEVEDFDDRHKDTRTGRSRLINTQNGSYGLRTLLDTIGFERSQVPEHMISDDKAQHFFECVKTLLGALARASTWGPGAPRPRVLKITARELIGHEHAIAEFMSAEDLRLYDDEVGLLGVSDDAFQIPAFLRPTLAPVVEALEELELDVYSETGMPEWNQPWLFRTRNMLAFLGMPKRLRKLRIRRFACAAPDGPSQRNAFWRWLAAAPQQQPDGQASQEEEADVEGAATRIPSPALSHLRELDLGNEDIPSTLLCALVKKVSPTLEKLTLSGVVIRERYTFILSPGFGPRIKTPDFHAVEVEAGLWADLCDMMATTATGLCEVHLAGFGCALGRWHLLKVWGGGGSVFFKQLRISPGEAYTARAEFSYKGPRAKEALEELAEDLRAAVCGDLLIDEDDMLKKSREIWSELDMDGGRNM